jgi:hypothetical protein
MKTYCVVEGPYPSLITSALDGDDRSVSNSGYFFLGEESYSTQYGTTNWLWCWVGTFALLLVGKARERNNEKFVPRGLIYIMTDYFLQFKVVPSLKFRLCRLILWNWQTNHISGNLLIIYIFSILRVQCCQNHEIKIEVFWDKMLCHWATLFDVSKDFLAFIFRVTLKIKATQSFEIRITVKKRHLDPSKRRVPFAQRHRKFKSSATPLCEPQISYEDVSEHFLHIWLFLIDIPVTNWQWK